MTRYWVGGAGTWDASDTTHWSADSGGAGGAAVPSASDNVVFDSESNAPGDSNYTCTLGTGTPVCKNLTVGNPSSGVATVTGSAKTIRVSGSLSVESTAILFTAVVEMLASSGTNTITLNGTTLQSLTLNGAGTFQLVDNLTLGKSLTLTAGTFDTTTNNTTVTFGNTTDTSTIPSLEGTFTGSNSFYNLTIAKNNPCVLTITGNVTVNNTLILTGYTVASRLLLKSSVVGTPRIITTPTVTAVKCDFQDITGAGDASWDLHDIVGGCGNCGGNSMKALGDAAFTSPTIWYYHAASTGTDTFATIAKWSDQTNGLGNVATYPPLPQDTARFDINSFDSDSKTVTQNMQRTGSVDWTGATNTPTFTPSTVCSVYGSITLIAGMVLTSSNAAYTLAGRGEYTLDSAELSWGTKPFYVAMPDGTLTLKSNLTTTGALYVKNGTLTCIDGANNWAMTINTIEVSSGAILTLGSATHTITNAGNAPAWNIITGGTVNAGTSTIKFNGVRTYKLEFTGGGQAYYNVWNATTGAYTFDIIGTNSFNEFKIDAGRTVRFTNSTTSTFTNFTALGTSENHIVVSNTSSTTKANLVKSGGVVSGCDYIDFTNIAATPDTLTWYVGANSTSTTSTGLILEDPPGGDVTVTPDTQALSLTAQAPTENFDFVHAVSAQALSLLLKAPTENFDYAFSVATKNLSLSKQASSITLSPIVSPNALALMLALNNPTTVFDCSLSAATKTLSAYLQNPSLAIGPVVSPNTLTLTSNLQNPSQLFDFTQQVASKTLNLSLQLPTENFDYLYSASVKPLTLALNQSTENYDYVLAVSTKTLVSSLEPPTPTWGGTISPPAFELTLNSLLPSISRTANVYPNSFELTSTLLNPTTPFDVTVSANVLALALALQNPNILQDLTFSVNPLALNISLQNPFGNITITSPSITATTRRTSFIGTTKNTSITGNTKNASFTGKTKNANIITKTKGTSITAKTKQ